MSENRPSLREKLRETRAVRTLKAVLKPIGNNFGAKVLSLFMAILLWNYVITNNPSLTRTKVVNNLVGVVTGHNALTRVALLGDPADAISNVTVVLEVSQSEFAYVNPTNVHVTLDLSNIRTEGTQQVRLSARTTYGHIVSIYPETLTLTFEPRDSRELPVSVAIDGEKSDDLWYNVSRTNPTSITVSGASSLVNSIRKVQIVNDVTDATETFTSARRYALLDADGYEIDASMLNLSTSSVSVTTEIYPKKELPISTDAASLFVGKPAEGYVIESVNVQPQMITIAGERDLLDGMEALYLEPIDIEGATQPFSVRATVSALSSLKYVSAQQVYVTVNISEEISGTWVDNVPIVFLNKKEGTQVYCDRKTMRVYIKGPNSAIEELSDSDFVVSIDLADVEPGRHSMEVTYPTELWPQISFAAEDNLVSFTVTEKGAQE